MPELDARCSTELLGVESSVAAAAVEVSVPIPLFLVAATAAAKDGTPPPDGGRPLAELLLSAVA